MFYKNPMSQQKLTNCQYSQSSYRPESLLPYDSPSDVRVGQTYGHIFYPFDVRSGKIRWAGTEEISWPTLNTCGTGDNPNLQGSSEMCANTATHQTSLTVPTMFADRCACKASAAQEPFIPHQQWSGILKCLVLIQQHLCSRYESKNGCFFWTVVSDSVRVLRPLVTKSVPLP